MYVFIDDSGDPGFEIGIGSTRYFVLAAVAFASVEDADETRAALGDLKTGLGWPAQREFKAAKMKFATQLEILQRLDFSKIQVLAISVQKSALSQEERGLFNYKSSVKALFDIFGVQLAGSIAKLDGAPSRPGKQELRKLALNADVEDPVKSLTLMRSHGEVLLQLADLVACAIRRGGDPEDSFFDKFRSLRSLVLRNPESEVRDPFKRNRPYT